MIGKIILIGGLAFVAGSVMTQLDGQAGDGATKTAVGHSIDQLAGLTGEAAAAGPKVVAAVQPAVQQGLAVAGNTLGAAGQGAAAAGQEGAGDPGGQP